MRTAEAGGLRLRDADGTEAAIDAPSDVDAKAKATLAMAPDGTLLLAVNHDAVHRVYKASTVNAG